MVLMIKTPLREELVRFPNNQRYKYLHELLSPREASRQRLAAVSVEPSHTDPPVPCHGSYKKWKPRSLFHKSTPASLARPNFAVEHRLTFYLVSTKSHGSGVTAPVKRFRYPPTPHSRDENARGTLLRLCDWMREVLARGHTWMTLLNPEMPHIGNRVQTGACLLECPLSTPCYHVVTSPS